MGWGCGDNLHVNKIYILTKETENPVRSNMSLIRILGSEDEVLDIIDATNEEPFLLETLEQLIANHQALDKKFIIARAETVNSGAQSPYFYYAAHQLNKVIFRKYGPESEYLFRLYSLNPLTNTEISGDLHYFMVEKSDDLRVPHKTLQGHGGTQLDERRKQSQNALMKKALGNTMEDLKVAEMSGLKFKLHSNSILRSNNAATFATPPTTSIHEKSNQNTTGSFASQLEKNTRLQVGSLQSIVEATSFKSVHCSTSPQPMSISSPRAPDFASFQKLTFRNKSKSTVKIVTNMNAGSSLKSIANADTQNVLTFVARFIGTDDDFLQNISIRELFRDNAYALADNDLFDIPEDVLINEHIIPANAVSLRAAPVLQGTRESQPSSIEHDSRFLDWMASNLMSLPFNFSATADDIGGNFESIRTPAEPPIDTIAIPTKYTPFCSCYATPSYRLVYSIKYLCIILYLLIILLVAEAFCSTYTRRVFEVVSLVGLVVFMLFLWHSEFTAQGWYRANQPSLSPNSFVAG